ncbi:hypothetical protein ACOJBO_25545 [Rhizobium beringeri]
MTIIDADPNKPISDWRSGDSRLPIKVVSDVTETNIRDKINSAASEAQFVFVDLEGTASRLASRAIIRSDLTLIPLAGTALDAKQAARAVGLIKENEEDTGKKFSFSLVFNRTNPRRSPGELNVRSPISSGIIGFLYCRHISTAGRPITPCSWKGLASMNSIHPR